MARPDVPKMTWRKCECPLDDTQDGVCGCPQFWERKVSRLQVQSNTDSNTKENPTEHTSSCTTPPGSPREICFFWYHGTCRRGDQCKLAHESYITWPMTAPPGFAHFTLCTLSLCPLRQNLVAFTQTEMRKQEKPSPQLGGQIDGTALSCLSRSTPIEVMSSDCESIDIIEDVHNEGYTSEQDTMSSLIDPSSRALNGSYSDSSDSGNDNDGEEAALEVTAGPQEFVPESRNINDRATSSPSHSNMDYFDVSEFAPPPPSSDTDETPLLSLSHPGTLRKRERSTSLEEQNNSKKRAKRELTPDLDPFVSILKRDRLVNFRDQRPLDQSNYHGSAQSADPLPSKLQSITPQSLFIHDFPSSLPNSHSFTPTGPRALSGNKLICFYWYHKGHCTPKRRHGRFITCNYEHNLNMPSPQVSLPPVVTDHNPNCPLPLCPAHLSDTKSHGSNMRVRRTPEPFMKHEIITSPRRRAVDTSYSSSPRDGISEARCFVKGPRFNRDRSSQQLPKLTGANRERFKIQKRSIGQWQADNGVKTFDMNRKLAEERKQKRMKKYRKREKRMRQATEGHVLDYGNEALRNPIEDPHAGSVTQRSKENEDVIRDAGGFLEADAIIEGSIKKFDPEAELRKSSFRPIGGSPEYMSLRDSWEEMEDQQQHDENTTSVVRLPKDGSKPSSQRPLRMAPLTIDMVERPNSMVNLDEGARQKIQANEKTRIVVDYELPEGDVRLDWDTDRVRRLFGEIE